MTKTATAPAVGRTVKVAARFLIDPTSDTAEVIGTPVKGVVSGVAHVLVRFTNGTENSFPVSALAVVPTAQELAVAYRKVADDLEGYYSIQSDEDVDHVIYNFNSRDQLATQTNHAANEDLALAYLLVWDSADGQFGDVAREAARLFNATL